jgi:hypothetical protein
MMGGLVHYFVPPDTPTLKLTQLSQAPIHLGELDCWDMLIHCGHSQHQSKIQPSKHPILSKIWLLWELVLVGEPIVILGSSPPQCSGAVMSLMELICPLAYGGNARPYFTIQDKDFNEILEAPVTSERKRIDSNLLGLLIGVTNPYFLKALNHWPHFLHLASELAEYEF